MDLPAAFDPAFYRARHPDLAAFSDAQARDHYELFGRNEGRMASPCAERGALLAHARQPGTKLEIGPFCSPVLAGDDVHYLDVLDAGQLRERALAIGADPAGCPAHIHYVGSLDQVTERFDLVFSSHCIEHQPDLVAHLNGVARVLKPGGRYFLIVPDKRFCFDHFIAETTVAQVVDAHLARRRVHSVSSVIEHIALTTHNDPVRHWQGDHGPPPGARDAARIGAALDLLRQNDGGYIDVHASYFTPESFRRLIDTLRELGMVRFRTGVVYDTPFNYQEFCAVLEFDDLAAEQPAALEAA